ncbi:MAG: ribosome silencing factor [Bacteroidetes bacterium]|nr:ribosome silencing factor [Bacteroidota bacterium]
MAKTTASRSTKTTKKPAAKTAAPKKPRATSTAAKRPAPKRAKAVVDTQKQIAHVAALYTLEKKATDVKILDVRGITAITDFFIVCSASSDAQVKAIGENVIVKMREDHGLSPWKTEGWDALQWVILDFVDFVVHVFRESAREFYHLERLWADAPTETVEDVPAKKTRTTKKAS